MAVDQYKPSLEFETDLGFPVKNIAGIDEVGRGCLVGSVVAAAVLLPRDVDFVQNPWLHKVTDSKKLSPKLRDHLYDQILNWVPAYGLGEASPAEIDQLNIFHATHVAMKRALDSLASQTRIDSVLVDGKYVPPGVVIPQQAVIKGDSRSLSIACASILAKVTRDRMMTGLDERFPGYSFSVHKGYPTAVHLKALRALGLTPEHRRSFGPCQVGLPFR